MTYQEHEDDDLKALLAELPQPKASAELDAAILARAQKALEADAARPPAANDRDSDNKVRSLPVKKSPDYLQRWRVPLGLAAAVLLTVNMIGIDWFGSKPAQFPMVGEPTVPTVPPPVAGAMTAPETAPAPAQDAAMASAPALAPALPPPPQPAPVSRPVPQQKTAPMAEAPAEAALEMAAPAPAPAPAPTPAPAPAPAAVQAQVLPYQARSRAAMAPMPAPARLDAGVWLVKIDGLLKAGETQVAQDEWRAFRQNYPDYPVEQQLRAQLEAPAR